VDTVARKDLPDVEENADIADTKDLVAGKVPLVAKDLVA
jgi:hypothetical protein